MKKKKILFYFIFDENPPFFLLGKSNKPKLCTSLFYLLFGNIFDRETKYKRASHEQSVSDSYTLITGGQPTKSS